MGASLSVNITQTGVNETSRTATVGVTVTITSTAGTHNHYGSSTLGQGAILYVTIDGSTYSSYISFGSSETGTFTSTVYSGSTTVSYGSSSTRTISVSARCITGTSAGTISGSDSVSLTSIGASSGGSGSGGDDYDDSEEYKESTVIPNTGDMALVPGNSTLLGQCNQEIIYGGWIDYTAGSSSTVGPQQHPTYSKNVYMVSVIMFKTPKLTGVPVSLSVALDVGSGSKSDALPANIALCSSDANRSKYIGATSSVTDEYQISVGSINLVPNSFCFTTLQADTLESETVYYLILWLPSDNKDVNQYINDRELNSALNHAINVNYIEASIVYISDGTNTDEFYCYIDNGSSYEPYILYIDNGGSWEIYG